MTPYIEALRAYANSCVTDYQKNKPASVLSTRMGKFQSATDPSVYYTVLESAGRLNCNCPGFTYRRKCKHIEACRI